MVWNGTENVTMLVKGSNLRAYTKGQVFSYDTDGTEKDGDKEVQVIKSYTAVSQSAAMLGASADGKKFDVELTNTGVASDSRTYKVTEDTTVLFLDGKKGVAGGDLTSYAAMESSIKDLFIKNVYYKVDKDKDLDLLVVAVDGKLALNSDLGVATSPNPAGTVDMSKKTIVFPNGTTVNKKNVKAQFTNVLKVVKISDDKYTVVANDGSEYTFTVSVAINSIAVSLTAPTKGAPISTSTSGITSTAGVKVNSIKWINTTTKEEVTGTFDASTIYKAEIQVSAQDGYTIASAATVTGVGDTATYENGVITVTFTATGA